MHQVSGRSRSFATLADQSRNKVDFLAKLCIIIHSTKLTNKDKQMVKLLAYELATTDDDRVLAVDEILSV